MKSPRRLGIKLETDNKLIATAYVSAYQYPITILTRDSGIKELVKRVGDKIKLEYASPKNQIRVVDISYKTNSLIKRTIYPEIEEETLESLLDQLLLDRKTRTERNVKDAKKALANLANAIYTQREKDNIRLIEPRGRIEAKINIHEILEIYILDTTQDMELLKRYARRNSIEYDRVKQILSYFNLETN